MYVWPQGEGGPGRGQLRGQVQGQHHHPAAGGEDHGQVGYQGQVNSLSLVLV